MASSVPVGSSRGAPRPVFPSSALLGRAQRLLARPLTLTLLAVAIGGWVIANVLSLVTGWPRVDVPPELRLQSTISAGVLFVVTVLLLMQVRSLERAVD